MVSTKIHTQRIGWSLKEMGDLAPPVSTPGQICRGMFRCVSSVQGGRGMGLAAYVVLMIAILHPALTAAQH